MTVDTVAERTVLGALQDNARRVPDKSFIEYEDVTITYAQFWDRVQRLAAGLERLGIKAQDKVMIHLPNCPEYLMSWFAITRLGAVVVPCSTNFKHDEIRYQIEHSDAAAVIVARESYELVAGAAAAATTDPRMILCDPGGLESGGEELNALLSGEALTEPWHAGPDDVAMIMYTSGTTARPKGVILTHGNLYLYGHNWASAYCYTRDDRVLHYFPLYHSNGGIALLMPSVLRGATIVMQPKFSVSNFIDVVTSKGITVTAFNATHVKYLLSTPPTDRDRAHRMYRAHFALELDAERRQAFEDRFGIRLVELYGLTEAGIVTCVPVDALWKEGSGPPVPGYELKIVDDESHELPRGDVGEIVCRSLSRHGISPGYYKQASETAAVLRDGWLFTGDMGYLDADDYLHFAQRKKDMIKRSGYNIGAAEVERALTDHAGVVDAAVVGIADDLKQEAIVAYVVVTPGANGPSESDLIGHCRELLADYKVPQHVVIVESLPETFIGKVDKKLLRAQAEDLFSPAVAG
jgi:crotonobetaine/carnitine-CoA ligase